MSDPVQASSSHSAESFGSSATGLSFLEQEIAAGLRPLGAVADRAMVLRTQRLVRERALEIVERRRRARHAIGLAILGFSLLYLVLTPVLWSGVQILKGSQSLLDAEPQFVYVIGWLFPVTLITLFLVFLRTRGNGVRKMDRGVAARLGSMVR